MQSDVPAMGLEQAIAIPRALADHYAVAPTRPINVAVAIDIKPSSSSFRMLCGASIAYGMTTGGYNANVIEVTELGKRIVRPTRDGQDLVAKREAFLKPRVLGEFLSRYDGSPIPKREIAINVLEEMGVPRQRGAKTYELIREGAKSFGLLQEIKGQEYVNLAGGKDPDPDVPTGSEFIRDSAIALSAEGDGTSPPMGQESDGVLEKHAELEARKRRVFVAHGKNTSFLGPIRELLQFGELEPVVSAEKHTVSQPVPDKVLIDMRSCGATIIHVDVERILKDTEGNEHPIVNENVLIEIGAAMALYGRRFILLVKSGVSLPSNLQGLYEVRYEGGQLDGTATIALLKAINDIKNNRLPEEDA